MALFNLTVGIVSCGRIGCLTECLRSFDDVEFDIATEVIIIENQSPTSGECIALAKQFVTSSDLAVRHIIFPLNYGFYAAWNCIATLAHGEWLLMLQDDTHFCPELENHKLSTIIDYAKEHGYLILNLFGLPEFVYSDWPHLEHRTVRRDLVSDFHGYPRYKDLHGDAPTFEETRFGRIVIEKDIPRGSYTHNFAGCQDRATRDSIYQRLLHNAKHLTDAEREEVIYYQKFDEYDVARWGD